MIVHDLFSIGIPISEKIIRTVLVYGGLAVLLRVGGKRGLAQLNTFDLVVIMLLSNVVQNAVIGNDNSLSGGLLGAAVLIAVNAVVVRAANRYPALTRVFEGSSALLVEDGTIIETALRRLGLRDADVTSALRRQGADEVREVKEAVLAPGGTIVVELKHEARDVTLADLEHASAALTETHHALLRAELARVEEQLSAQLESIRAAIARS